MNPNDILAFWYGEIIQDGTVSPDIAKSWWTKNPERDAYIKSQFGELLEQAIAGQLDD